MKPAVARGYEIIVTTNLQQEFQVGMRVRADRLDALELDLHTLEEVYPRMQRVEFRANPGEDSVMALLDFGDGKSVRSHEHRIRDIATRLGAEVYDVENLVGESREEFVTRCEAMTLRSSASDSARALKDLKRQFADPPRPAQQLIRLAYRDRIELLSAWARHVGEGAIWVPTPRPAPRGDIPLVFVAGTEEFHGNVARVSPRPPPPDQVGFWLAVQPGEELKALLEARVHERRISQPTVDGVAHGALMTNNRLLVTIASIPDLEDNYESDLGKGTLFVCCTPAPELKARLQLILSLPSNEELVATVEVINRVLSGPRTGVRVQLVERFPEVKAAVESLIAAHKRRRPKVLVVDDEAIWRSTLARGLTELGADVQLASDGHQAMLKLIEGYFDLDLVVLDLHMPEIDGLGLLERVRTLGGDSTLKMFLFSAAGPDELARVASRGLATEVFSKGMPFDTLTGRIAQALGLTDHRAR